MATITSANTEAEISAAYFDNCGYDEDESSAMARRFVTVCRAMLHRGIRAIEQDGRRMEVSPAELRALIADARNYARATGRVKHVDLRDFRT